MAAMVIEVPEELKALGEAVADVVAAVTKARAPGVGGKSVDYGAIEVKSGGAATGPCGSP